MAATIKIKNSSTAGAAPTSSDLVQGELAVNVTDKRLYTENASGTIVELGTNPSVPVTFPDGSASAPSLTNDGDTNTGIFFPAADTIALTTGGTERARVDSSGNLGLGVTPSAQLASYKSFQFGIGGNLIGRSDNAGIELSSNAYRNTSGNYIYLNTDNAASYRHYNGQHQWFNAASGTAGNAITFTQAMTLDASGNLIVGGTSPTTSSGYTSLSINNATNSGYVVLQNNGTNKSDWFVSSGTVATLRGVAVPLSFEATGANYVKFETNGSERARIDSSGNLLVGKTAVNNTNTGITLDLGSTGVKVVNSASTSAADGFQMYSTGAGGYRFYVNFAGTIFATNTTISSLSDVRYKENIVDLDVGLNSIMALKPRKFDWKEGKGANIKNARGFIAQEFEEVFPDLIDEWRDAAPEGEEPYKSVRADLIPVLVKAIQELKAIVDAQAAEIAALKGQA